MWPTVLQTLQAEFSDLGDAEAFTRAAVRLVLAVVLGGIIGFERELHGRAAGLRTHMMVALGVAVVLVAGDLSGMDNEALGRVLQGVLAGIGFLGAGAIIKQDKEEQVKGLTTAGSVWATAGIAAAAGLGLEATAVLATVIALIILYGLLKLEERIASKQRGR